MKCPNQLSAKHLFLFFCMSVLLLSCQSNERIELTFGFSPYEEESIQPLIDQFNAQHKGKIKVNWEKTAVASDAFFQQVVEDFQSEEVKYDIIAGDVVWTAAFAANNWVENVSPQFYQDYRSSDFVEAALSSATYNFDVWGIPWYTDAGILFYRKDLLDQHGFTAPPRTWDDLKAMTKQIMPKSNIKYGYLFQGANYEGGVANACEFIWNAGGIIAIGNLAVSGDFQQMSFASEVIMIDSEESASGFRMARSLIEEGISPAEVATFQEAETSTLFRQGEALFLRGWPGNYSYFNSKESKVKPSQVGVCMMPVMAEQNTSFSCLGGWNLMINARTADSKKKAAWAFIKFLTDPEQQRYRAIKGGTLPSLKQLYEEPELMAKAPTMSIAKEVIRQTRPRPISPLYMDFSPKISNYFNRVLKGEVQPGYATEMLQWELEQIETQAISSSQ